MRLFKTKRPSERNQRIFAQVEGGLSQTEVAAEYGLSQAQVSRICQKVGVWLARNRIVNACAPEEAMWLAHRKELNTLHAAQSQAKAAFEKTLEPRIELHEAKGGDGAQTRVTKSPQASASLLYAYVRVTKEVRLAEVAEVQAAELLRESYQDKPDYKEDKRVEQVIEQVEQACDIAQRLQRRGYETPPIPKLSRRELAEEIRRKLRGTPEASARDCMPADWQMLQDFLASDQLFERRKTGEQVYPVASSGHLGAPDASSAAMLSAVATTTSVKGCEAQNRPNSPSKTGINGRRAPANCPGPVGSGRSRR
jgi:hypothetical protein